MIPIGRMAVAVFAIAALAACQSSSAQRPTVNISAAESPILFAYPGPTVLTGRYFRQRAADFSIESHMAVWAPGPNLNYPVMRIIYHALEPYRYFTKFSADLVSDYVTNLDFGDGGKPTLGSRLSTRTALGPVHIQRFILNGHACFGFEQVWGPSGTISALGNKRLIGFFCDAGSEELRDSEIESIVQSIGVRGQHVPDHVAAAAQNEARRMETYPLQVQWQGRYPDLQATMSVSTDSGGKSGRLAVDLPNGSGSCTGSWQLGSGGAGTGSPGKGHWRILCTNGVSAEGTYESPRVGQVSGHGTDSEGKPVTFRGQDG